MLKKPTKEEPKKMIIESINLQKVWAVVREWWAQSMVAVLLFILGIFIGSINAESRIVADCKFAGVFRVEIQAFSCQRKI